MDERPTSVNYQRIEQLQYLGNYVRELPVSMARMMENALDWEHLSHVHASSFSDIQKMDSGQWGWRARALPALGEGGWQELELLLDSQRHYWATSVISGPAASIEIHTQASALSDKSIQVDVRFYSSIEVPDDQVGLYLDVLQQQYALLYDEDESLMQGRQSALDARARRSASADVGESEILVGSVKALSKTTPNKVDTEEGSYCVRHHGGQWVVHSAACPHMLGPLDAAPVSAEGIVTCPWHGYQFDIATGDNVDGKCRALAQSPGLLERDDRLYLVFGQLA
ncbi:MAG: Rieske (2Fe-2S) protein [Halioglobus sp.]